MPDEEKSQKKKNTEKKGDKTESVEQKPQTIAQQDAAGDVVGAPPPDASASGAAKKKVKGGKHIPSGIAYVQATFNNTKVTFTDLHGNTICWGTAGKAGFKGSKKSTAYVAQLVATEAAKKAMSFGMKECEVRINGPGAGRESAVRGISAAGIDINALQDITPVPHNGCRPPKRRRV
jgi:small subunit ribosomal protein S11